MSRLLLAAIVTWWVLRLGPTGWALWRYTVTVSFADQKT